MVTALEDEKPQVDFSKTHTNRSDGEDDGTIVGEGSVRNNSPPRPTRNHLNVFTDNGANLADIRSLQSPSRTREEAHRFQDELVMLKVERQTSTDERERNLERSRSKAQSSSRREEPPDDFDIATNPTYEKGAVYKPPENPSTSVAKIFKKIHSSVFFVRWFFYIAPVTCIILIPLLLGALLFKGASVGKVRLDWFCIWLEIVWLSLWAGRVSSCKLRAWLTPEAALGNVPFPALCRLIYVYDGGT